MKPFFIFTFSFLTLLTACGMDKPDHSDVRPPGSGTVAATGVSVRETLAAEVGLAYKLTATVEPENATEKSVTWSTSDRTVAAVDKEGNVSVFGPGKAVITVKTYDGKFDDTCTVTATDPDEGKEYGLVWAEEFDYEGLPSSENWIIQNWQPGHVNHELQTYVTQEKNLDVRDGVLTITAVKERDGRVTSGRIESAGKKSFTYGRFEIRAKLPFGKGTWPAIWMLGENINHGTGWPTCGEIDIMEHVGYDQNAIVASAHTRDRNHVQGTQASGRTTIEGVSSDFHVYSVEWTRTSMTWSVDGVPYYTYKPNSLNVGDWPFFQPEFIILNVAWGGDWGGAQGIDESVLPQKMEVDYVRVYQKK